MKEPNINAELQRIREYALWLIEEEREALQLRELLGNPIRVTGRATRDFLKRVFRAYKEIEEECETYQKAPKDFRWMITNKRLDRTIRQTRFYDLLLYLVSKADWEQSEAVAATLPEEKTWIEQSIKSRPKKGRKDRRGEKVRRKLVLLRVNVQHAAQVLDMSERSVWLYLQGFERLGIIHGHGQSGGHNLSRIYSIGTWQRFGGTMHKRLFYVKNNPEWLRKIADFKVRD